MLVKTPPDMSLISDSTMNEDTVSTAISFTVTDINEQALTITITVLDDSFDSASTSFKIFVNDSPTISQLMILLWMRTIYLIRLYLL
jgi:hypothetical protein